MVSIVEQKSSCFGVDLWVVRQTDFMIDAHDEEAYDTCSSACVYGTTYIIMILSINLCIVEVDHPQWK